MKPYSLTFAPAVYAILQRMHACPHCGAAKGEKCIGASGKRIEATHTKRKDLTAQLRRDNRNLYRALRDAVVKNMWDSEISPN